MLPPWLAGISGRDLRRGLLRWLAVALPLGGFGGWAGGAPGAVAGASFSAVLLVLALLEGWARRRGLPRLALAVMVAALTAALLGLAYAQQRYVAALLQTHEVGAALQASSSVLPKALGGQGRAGWLLLPWLLLSTVLSASHAGRVHGDGSWSAVTGELQFLAMGFASLCGVLVVGLSLLAGREGLGDAIVGGFGAGLCVGIGVLVVAWPLQFGLEALLRLADAVEGLLSPPS